MTVSSGFSVPCSYVNGKGRHAELKGYAGINVTTREKQYFSSLAWGSSIWPQENITRKKLDHILHNRWCANQNYKKNHKLFVYWMRSLLVLVVTQQIIITNAHWIHSWQQHRRLWTVITRTKIQIVGCFVDGPRASACWCWNSCYPGWTR